MEDLELKNDFDLNGVGEVLEGAEERTLQTRFFVLANFVKMFFYLVVGAAIFYLGFYLESRPVETSDFAFNAVTEIDFGDYSKQVLLPAGGVMRFASDEEFEVAANLDVKNLNIDLKNPEYLVEMMQGKIWANFSNSNANANILLGQVVLIPKFARFEIEYANSRVILRVYDGDLYLGLLYPGVEVTGYLDELDPSFMNRLLVPRGTQVVFPMSKIDERLAPLLYSKLVKELKLTLIPEAEYSKTWYTQNNLADQRFSESLRQAFLSSVELEAVSSGGLFSDIALWFRENFTFVPDKKEQILIADLFRFLDKAILAQKNGDQVSADLFFADFERLLSSLPQKYKDSIDLINKLDQITFSLSRFVPTDQLFPVFKRILNNNFIQKKELLKVLDLSWNVVYIANDISPSLGREALRSYYQYFDNLPDTFIEEVGKERYLFFLTYQNQLLNNLFIQSSVFYDDLFFSIKKSVEDRLLREFNDGELKTELLQTLINDKINYLKRLRTFFFSDLIPVEQARRVFTRLYTEVNGLLELSDSSLAVLDLFEIELDDVDSFYRYLQDSEYNSNSIYGNTHKERYETFLREEKISNVFNLDQEIFGSEAGVNISLRDLQLEVESFLTQSADFDFVEVGELKDVGQRLVPVTGRIGGFDFKANFDRGNDLLRDIFYVKIAGEDELVSADPVPVAGLLILLQSRFADFADDGNEVLEDLVQKQDSHAARAAKNYLVSQISDLDFFIEPDDIEISSADSSIFRVTNIYLKGYENISLSFDYNVAEGEKLMNIYMVFEGRPVTLEGGFTIDELKQMILADQDFAALSEEESVPQKITR